MVAEPLLGVAYPYWVHGFYILVTGGILAWVFRNEIKVFQFIKNFK
jgi:hypothetical protein